MTNLKRVTTFIKKAGNVVTLQVGEFKIVSTLGQGGNGIVYEAKFGDKTLAMKFLVTDTKGKSSATKTKRFVAEYFNIALLDKNDLVVKYVDLDELSFSDDEGELSIPVIIMKKYDSSLTSLAPARDSASFLKLTRFLLDAIEQIHDQGIVHRDIKPENILTDAEGFVLADFGIAAYNPKIFTLRAKTAKGERVANRLFSAPEQEESGIEPHPTMDIFALGQVMQWYATGKTHRGTGRPSITSFVDHIDIGIYDNIIERCLQNNPSHRFQSVTEIREYIQRRKHKGPFVLLPEFNEIFRSSFPKARYEIAHSSDPKRIDLLFQKLRDALPEFGDDLWWHNGSSNSEIHRIKHVSPGVWNIDDTEFSIKEVWVNFNSSHYGDFILVHYLPGEPFDIEGRKRYYTTIVDGSHTISEQEHSNGFAEIDGDIVDLAKHQVEFIERNDEEGFIFIGTRYHCILLRENDVIVREHVASFATSTAEEITTMLKEFSYQINQNKHEEVLYNL